MLKCEVTAVSIPNFVHSLKHTNIECDVDILLFVKHYVCRVK
jgi:hypothetical protein